MDIEKIERALSSYRGYTIYTGFSGGADSTALLLLLKQLAAQLNFNLIAIHFEHGLRGDSSLADAEWCRDFCAMHAIQIKVIPLGLNPQTPNIEAVAREKRLEQWQNIIRNCSEPAVVALAHHADDRVENLFIRLCRGSNATGLSSLRFSVKIDQVEFIRPLIEFSRAQIVDFLTGEEIAWREDETNAIAEFTRNFFRNNILPTIYSQLEYARDGIKHAAAALTQDAEFIEYEAARKYRDIAGQNSTPAALWRELPAALLPRLLRMWFKDNNITIIPDRDLLERVTESLNYTGHEPRFIPLRRGGFIRYGNNEYRLVPEKFKHEPVQEKLWQWRSGPLNMNGMTFSAVEVDGLPDDFSADTAFFDAAQIPETLIICSWQSGDRMVPFGAHSAVKLKKLFTDAKISAAERSTYPIIRLPGRKIIWVPGLRRSNFAPGVAGRNIAISVKSSSGGHDIQ